MRSRVLASVICIALGSQLASPVQTSSGSTLPIRTTDTRSSAAAIRPSILPSGVSFSMPNSRCSERSGSATCRSPSVTSVTGVLSVSARRNNAAPNMAKPRWTNVHDVG
jgi:hypothetical protein